MNGINELDYVETVAFEAEHCDVSVEEAYETVSKWLDDFGWV